MICTSIQNKTFEQIKAILADPAIEMAEIRLDLCPIAVEEITELFRNAAKPLVATYRFKGNRPPEHTLTGTELTTGCYGWDRLSAAIEAGAMFADLELEAEPLLDYSGKVNDKECKGNGGQTDCNGPEYESIEKKLVELCHKHGTRIIRSYHNFECTPSLATLKKKVMQCFDSGADIAKIATTAKNFKDTCTIDSLYNWFSANYSSLSKEMIATGIQRDTQDAYSSTTDETIAGSTNQLLPEQYGKNHEPQIFELIAFAMGELGRVSRVDCLMNGAPFTYASLNANECTAPGQLSTIDLNGLLYNKKSKASLESANASITEGEKAIVSMFSLENIVLQKNDNRKELYLNKIYDSIPASKSYAQRAIIAAALAHGTSHIYNYTPCADSEAAIEVAGALGAGISKEYTPIAYDRNINGHGKNNEIYPQDGGQGIYRLQEQKEACVLEITGIGATSGTRLHLSELHTGESGLLTRLMLPIVAGLNNEVCIFTGKGSLIGRPLKGTKEAMEAFGISAYNLNGKAGVEDRHGELSLRVPCAVMSRSSNCETNATNKDCTSPNECSKAVDTYCNNQTFKKTISGKDGSQIISGLMMSLPLCEHNTELIVENPKSVPYLEITADVLQNFGITINMSDCSGSTAHKAENSSTVEANKTDRQENSNSFEAEEKESANRDKANESIPLEIQGNQKYQAADIYLEADWSGAANLLVAGAILGRAQVHGLNRGSLQADSVIFEILAKAGASVSVNSSNTQILSSNQANNKEHLQSDQNSSTDSIQPQCSTQTEPDHTLSSATDIVTAVKAPLRAFNVSLENAPDLFPIVALLAAFCSGESRIEGTHRLVGKESDRAQAIVEMLRQMGVHVSLEDNTMIIRGESLSSRILNQRLPRGGAYSSHHDHRIAMALSVASLCTRSTIEIDDTECIAKSFPNFEC